MIDRINVMMNARFWLREMVFPLVGAEPSFNFSLIYVDIISWTRSY